jgi:hypothetical protein
VQNGQIQGKLKMLVRLLRCHRYQVLLPKRWQSHYTSKAAVDGLVYFHRFNRAALALPLSLHQFPVAWACSTPRTSEGIQRFLSTHVSSFPLSRLLLQLRIPTWQAAWTKAVIITALPPPPPPFSFKITLTHFDPF